MSSLFKQLYCELGCRIVFVLLMEVVQPVIICQVAELMSELLECANRDMQTENKQKTKKESLVS